MPLELRIEEFGDVQLSRSLLRFGDVAGDMRPAFRRIASRFAQVGEQQFDSEGQFGSGGWDPLAASTIAAKGNDTILVDEGDLRESLTGDDDRPGVRRVRIEPDELEWVSLDPKGRFHQRGTSRMPKRPPFELPERERRGVIKELQTDLIRALREGQAA